jgi:H+-transporting ATPase
MTGDGVNEPLPLKKADAVAGATDAAKSAAHIVLTRPGLSVIVDAIKEARKAFQRMQSYAIYRFAETVRVLVFIAPAILVFNFYPVTAIMIVPLALLNDAPIMAIAYHRVRYSLAPEKWNMRVALGMATLLGIIGVIASFLILYRAAPFKAGSGHNPILYVPETSGGRAPVHFSGPYPGPFLVYPPSPVLNAFRGKEVKTWLVPALGLLGS